MERQEGDGRAWSRKDTELRLPCVTHRIRGADNDDFPGWAAKALAQPGGSAAALKPPTLETARRWRDKGDREGVEVACTAQLSQLRPRCCGAKPVVPADPCPNYIDADNGLHCAPPNS